MGWTLALQLNVDVIVVKVRGCKIVDFEKRLHLVFQHLSVKIGHLFWPYKNDA